MGLLDLSPFPPSYPLFRPKSNFGPRRQAERRAKEGRVQFGTVEAVRANKSDGFIGLIPFSAPAARRLREEFTDLYPADRIPQHRTGIAVASSALRSINTITVRKLHPEQVAKTVIHPGARTDDHGRREAQQQDVEPPATPRAQPDERRDRLQQRARTGSGGHRTHAKPNRGARR
jgi:hypothetical protein